MEKRDWYAYFRNIEMDGIKLYGGDCNRPLFWAYPEKFADIYLCDKKIIKVLKDYLPETEAIKEADKQRLAWKAGLPVPEILDVIKIENRQAVVMEYITGDTLGNMMLKDISHAAGYIRIAMKKQIKINAVKGDG